MNLSGVFLLATSLQPDGEEAQGRIINMSGSSGCGNPARANSVAKVDVRIDHVERQEFTARGVTVNAMRASPGRKWRRHWGRTCSRR